MHQIRREKRTTISKVVVRGKREILSKIGIGFIPIFLLKVRVLYLTILKRKNLSLPLKVETDQFVIFLVLPDCLSIKICSISPSDSKTNHDGANLRRMECMIAGYDSADAEPPFPYFSSFSAPAIEEV